MYLLGHCQMVTAPADAAAGRGPGGGDSPGPVFRRTSDCRTVTVVDSVTTSIAIAGVLAIPVGAATSFILYRVHRAFRQESAASSGASGNHNEEK